MGTSFGRSAMSDVALAFVFATTSASGQQGAHATVVPQASRTFIIVSSEISEN